MTDRLARRRFNVLDKPELLRLAAWYEGIAHEYGAARLQHRPLKESDELVLLEDEARRRALEFRKLAASA